MDKENLILACIYIISEEKESCTFERMVAECFSQFPKVFSFKRYPKWPDSLKFDRPLRIMREKGLVVGSVRDYFSLTKFGEIKAINTLKELESMTPRRKQKTKILEGRSSEDKLIAYLKSSSPFTKYLKKKDDFFISESEFRSLLRCTLETPVRVVKQNMEYYKKLAKIYNEKQLGEFLLYCEELIIKGGNNGKGLAD